MIKMKEEYSSTEDIEETAQPKMTVGNVKNIYERVGLEGLLEVVWKASPEVVRLFSWPYAASVYKGLLEGSKDLYSLAEMHNEACTNSWMFNKLRPKFDLVCEVLQKYNISKSI
jgi:hypothetical protein